MKSNKQHENHSIIAKNKNVKVHKESQYDPLWHCQDHLMSLEKQKQLVQTENWDVTYEGKENPTNLSVKQIWL